MSGPARGMLLLQVAKVPVPCSRCNHATHTRGCPCCAAKAGIRKTSRRRGRGYTKPPRSKTRRKK